MELQPLLVGIDFGNAFSQVSYYNFKEKEPVSIDYTGLEQRYQIPTVISKTIGKEEWFSGDEARKCAALGEAVLVEDLLVKALDRNPVIVDEISMMPVELVRIFLDSLLQSVKLASGVEQIGKICITVKSFHISVLHIISEAVYSLGYPKEALILSCHEESYIYYALSQRQELWQGDVALFDYGTDGLRFYRLYMASERGMKIVMTHEEDLTEEIPFSLVQNKASTELLDARLYEQAKRLMEHKNFSTVYLTGKGFSEELKPQAPDFIRFVCDRRRVFAGQNLYTKGACYQAYAAVAADSVFCELLLACPQRITTGIEMKIEDRGRDKILRIIRPGINWYGADCCYDFIVDEAEALEIFLSPINTREKQVLRIPLTEFPDRPKKATRITLRLSFTSDSRCHLMVLDRGFGEFYAGSGRVINEEILL